MKKVTIGDSKYTIEKYDPENKEMIIKTYDKDTKMNVIIECVEDETTEKRWENFWRLFEQNEGRKILLKQQMDLDKPKTD